MRRSISLRGMAGSMRSIPMKYCSYSARKRSSRFSSSSSAVSSSVFSTRSALQGGDGEVIEAHGNEPVVERKVFVSFSEQRIGILERHDLHVVHVVTHGFAVGSLDSKAI